MNEDSYVTNYRFPKDYFVLLTSDPMSNPSAAMMSINTASEALNQGHNVIGVEISEIAIDAFFNENNLDYTKNMSNDFISYKAKEVPITIHCGDYFEFNMSGIGALYDRGSLVAVEPSIRLKYIKHTKSLLHKAAYRFIISLDYKEGYVQGPPYAIKISEILSFWPDLKKTSSYNDIENSSPKFKKSGLKKLTESVWIA